MDSADSVPTSARVRSTLSSARVAGLDLLGEPINGARFFEFGTVETIGNVRKPFSTFFASLFLLPRPASVSTLGVPVRAVFRNLDLLRVAIAAQFIEVADRKYLFPLRVE